MRAYVYVEICVYVCVYLIKIGDEGRVRGSLSKAQTYKIYDIIMIAFGYLI